MSSNGEMLTVEVVDSQTTFTLHEICAHGDCHAELVLKMVSYGIIEPVGELAPAESRDWQFDLAALIRLRKAIRLQRDLKMNLPGLAMSLDLLDELDNTRHEVARLRQQLGQLSEHPDGD